MSTTRRVDFHGKLDGRTELGDGSVRFNARLTRIGVFDYGDHKELRTEDEVFSKEALDSFKGLAVTVGHVAWIDGENWREHAIGHIGDDVRRDGEYVAASLIVKSGDALKQIDGKKLVEISMGYSVDLDETKGKTDAGEEYDSVQKNIRGNHAALGPEQWGRAGANVRLLDGAAYSPDMTTAGQRLDAPTEKDLTDARTDAADARKERDTARADRDAEKKRADTLEAERDAARRDADKAKKDLEDAKKAEDARVDARIALVDSARSILGKEFSHAGKSDRDIRVAALKKVDASFKDEGKSDDYVAAAFDLATKQVDGERASLGAINETSTNPGAQPKSKVDEAYAKADEEARKAHEAGPPATAAWVRK